MSLFERGHFVLASGLVSRWKIKAEFLDEESWATLALMASEDLPPFGSVEGVPEGGIPFANALREYVTEGPLLIAEDVCTTGGSMERYRAGRDAMGVCWIARGPTPHWVYPLFSR